MAIERKHQMGAGGYCVCPKCGRREVHQSSVRCIEQKCPACGSTMVREGSEHHQKITAKKG
ncbi:MAG: hypothetical protein JW718_07575 [Desulfovibrionaceae bacterium]|nr:hypothetical protein [Desulfovibrionaceae bacterium]